MIAAVAPPPYDRRLRRRNRVTPRLNGEAWRGRPLPPPSSCSPSSPLPILPVAMDDEIGDSREDLPLLGWWKGFQIGFGRLRVARGALAGVLHPFVLEHQPTNLLDLGGGQLTPPEQGPHAFGIAVGAALQHG